MLNAVQDVFLLFGDSITQGAWEPCVNGFGQRLSHVYARKLDVINRGYSGYNTKWSLPIFEKCIATRDTPNAPQIRVLVIWFGANDSCVKPSPQHVPLDEFKANLNQMVTAIKSPESARYSPTTRIILISPPPVNTLQRGADLAARDPPVALDRHFEVTRSYARAVKEVAEAENVGFVDIWTALWDAAGHEEKSLGKYLNDGLHLNEQGYGVLYEQLIAEIAGRYPEVHPDALPFVFLPWKELDW